jgi:hypothetical protein
MIDEDCTELPHDVVIWNSTYGIFRRIESFTKTYRSENEKDLGKGPPPMPPSDIARSVETLHALRNMCREIERRLDEKIRAMRISTNSIACNGTQAEIQKLQEEQSDWEKMINDVDLTLHEFRYRNSSPEPPFLEHSNRKRKAKGKQQVGQQTGIESALSRCPKCNSDGPRLSVNAEVHEGAKVQVEVHGRVAKGVVEEVDLVMDAAFLTYEEHSSWCDDFQPLRSLRMSVGGESSAGQIRPEDALPGKKVIYRDGREDTVSCC